MSDYPEHDKLQGIQEESQAIGEFIENGGYILCRFREQGNNGQPRFVWREGHERMTDGEVRRPTEQDFLRGRAEENPNYDSWGSGYCMAPGSIQDKLAAYFGIDQERLEAEKRAMLESIRA